MLFDTHCHLDAPNFSLDRSDVVARARVAGVTRILIPAISAATFADACAVSREFNCRLALGLHPLYLSEHLDQHLDVLREWIEREKVVAIGEIGLDFFVPGLDPERQKVIFNAQLRIARDFDLPVLLHVRRAQDEVLKVLRQAGVTKGIVHAFNGSRQQADAYIKQGFLLGFGGAMTWSRALNIRRLAADLPLESIVLETDAPDMPPEWLGQERNEPGQLARIAEVIAELRGLSPQAIAAATTANACALFPEKTT